MAAFVAAGICGFAYGAEAQQSGPVKLAPPTRLAPAPEAAPAPSGTGGAAPAGVAPGYAPEYKAGPRGQAVTTLSSVGSGSIQVDRLQVVTPDSAGILTTENGGFGIDMWRGTAMSEALAMLDAVPKRLESRVITDLVRRLALTPAQPPEGPTDGTQLALKRLAVLMAMADYPAALDLLSVMPSQGRGPGLLRAEAELRFLSGDNVAACALAGNEVRRNPGAFWQKALVFCQVLSDQLEKAELGISMLREVGTEDAAFFRLAEAMTTGATADLAALEAPDAISQSMLRYVKIEGAPEQFGRFQPGAVRALALNDTLPHALRLAAIEQAAGLGVFSDGALRKLVTKVATDATAAAEPPKADPKPDGAQPAADTLDTGPLARAKLYMTATQTNVAALKVEATSRALRSAKAEGAFAGTARLFRAELAAIPASSEHIWFAPDAVRAALFNGEIELAATWVALLKRYQLLASADTAALNDLDALIRILGAGEDKPLQPAATDAAQPALALLPRVILDALGERTEAAIWLRVAGGAAEGGGDAAPMPAPALWFALRALNRIDDDAAGGQTMPPSAAVDMPAGAISVQAAAAGGGVTVTELVAPSTGARSDISDKAARILTMARVAGGPAAANPIVVSEIIGGMKALGLDTEAKAFALEAALKAGF